MGIVEKDGNLVVGESILKKKVVGEKKERDQRLGLVGWPALLSNPNLRNGIQEYLSFSTLNNTSKKNYWYTIFWGVKWAGLD